MVKSPSWKKQFAAFFFIIFGFVGAHAEETVSDPFEALRKAADVQNADWIKRSAVFNPHVEVDPATHNKNHKLLIGIIDHGVDYRHPFLASKMHFIRESNGELRLGHDLAGDDNWPYYKVARNPELDPSGDAKSLQSRAATNSLLQEGILKTLLLESNVSLHLQSILDPQRDIFAETAVGGSSHGTLTSGLASYGLDEVGILPYRVFPAMKNWENAEVESSEVSDRILQATREAIRDGAKIINYSLVMWFDPGIQEEFHTIARDNPNVLFVAASGNDSKIMKDDDVTLPCGIDEPNVVCVAGTYYDHTIMQMSNVPKLSKARKLNLLFAVGTRVVSTSPSEYCASPTLRQILEKTEWPEKNQADTIKKMTAECDPTTSQLAMVSGTSFSTAYVTHEAARIWLKNLKLTPAQVVQKLNQASRTYPDEKHTLHQDAGFFEVIELPFSQPAWPKPKALNVL